MDSMSKRVRVAASSLKVLAANKTAVNVDIRERHRTDFLEVKVQDCSIDLGDHLDIVTDRSMSGTRTVSRYMSDAFWGSSLYISGASSSSSSVAASSTRTLFDGRSSSLVPVACFVVEAMTKEQGGEGEEGKVVATTPSASARVHYFWRPRRLCGCCKTSRYVLPHCYHLQSLLCVSGSSIGLGYGPSYSVLAMLRLGCRRTLGVVLRRHTDAARYASNSAVSSHHPNAPLELDPAFQALLRDVEISLRNKLPPNTSGGHGPRELEVFPQDPDTTLDYLTSAELDAQDEGFGKEHRKSPAAAFGSQRIGAVALPPELQSSIERMVAGKCFLRPPCSSCNLSASRCYC